MSESELQTYKQERDEAREAAVEAWHLASYHNDEATEEYERKYVDKYSWLVEQEDDHQDIREISHKLKQSQKALRFVLDHLVTRSAGNQHNPFAYLWTSKWDEFNIMANEALNDDSV